MTTVHVWQLIYANVEKEQSPHNRGGFQTLFYTRTTLTEAEVEEIEARLLYFPSDQVLVKSVFFMTSTGKHVIARIAPLIVPDRAGRGGRYLAHSLIFAAEDFARFGADPFQVFHHFSFFTTVDAALAHGDFQTGDIPTVPLEIPLEPQSGAEPAKNWSAPELQKLVLLALRADRFAHDKASIAFVGEPQYVEDALEAAYLAVPVSLRLHCSFDSYFYKGNLVATYYWAVGLLASPTNPRFTIVDARSRQVLGTAQNQPETAYERWVMALIDGNDLSFIARYREHAFAICEWLEGRSSEDALVDTASPEVINSVFQVNTLQVRERLRQRLSERLPSVLVNRIFGQFSRQTNVAGLFQQLRQGFALSQLLETLYQTYADQGLQAPEREETKALGELLHHENHRALRLAYLCWTDQQTQLRQALGELSEQNYREFLGLAQRYHLAAPLTLLVSRRGPVFLDEYGVPDPQQESVFLAFVDGLIKVGEASCLEQFISSLPHLSSQALNRLDSIVRRFPHIPSTFRTALDAAIDALPRAPGIVERFRTWLGRSPVRWTESRSEDEEKHLK